MFRNSTNKENMQNRINNNNRIIVIIGVLLLIGRIQAQNQLYIPPTVSGNSINLTVQSGFRNFYTSNPTPTFGINGSFLSPTIIVNKGDIVTLNVINTLTVPTTMHWHGLHVAPENDGGPHQIIPAGTTWSPSFEILNSAGTFWYHPHGEGKTELHVGKGLAGMFIIHDAAEMALNLPETYGIDDIPLITQTKAFDVLNQIAIADHMDTSIFVNGTLNAFDTLPSQIVRLRLLNGSSMRSFNYGFSNDMTFYQIATDGGLVDIPRPMNRILLAPGERTEILIDLTLLNGQSINLMSYGSEMPIGIFGSPTVGVAPDTMENYLMNPLNGTDYSLINFIIGNQTASPITTIPTTLVPFTPYQLADVDVNRKLILDTISLLAGETPSLAEGPFGINNKTFSMDSINIEVPLNSTEVWTLVNNTHIAHPFHIHDIEFNVIEHNGTTPPLYMQGWKDVVLVPPHDSVKFITKFITFSDEMTPYMYHCHLLHHEDDGMMGSFLVRDPNAGFLEKSLDKTTIFPNPSTNSWSIKFLDKKVNSLRIVSTEGKLIEQIFLGNLTQNYYILKAQNLDSGVYFIEIEYEKETEVIRLIKN